MGGELEPALLVTKAMDRTALVPIRQYMKVRRNWKGAGNDCTISNYVYIRANQNWAT